MFAVGGGIILTLFGWPFGVPGLFWIFAGLRFWAVAEGDELAGDVPPYFSRSCWVELYFVAAFSLSIVMSRSFCSSSSRVVTAKMR